MVHTKEELDKFGFAGFNYYIPEKACIIRFMNDQDWFIFPSELEWRDEGYSVKYLIDWLRLNGYNNSLSILLDMYLEFARSASEHQPESKEIYLDKLRRNLLECK